MLKMNLKGKKAFIAGVGDDQGFGWAIAKALAVILFYKNAYKL